MKLKNKLALLGLLILVALSLTACLDVSSSGNGEENNESTEKEVPETKAPEVKEGEEVIKIGYSGPISGPGAQYGINVLNGLEMAAEEINQDGFEVNGKTYKIEIVALDDKYLPNETGVNVQRMISEDDPVAVWIPHSGGVFATQVFNEQEDLIIMAQTSEPRMYEQGNELMIGISMRYNIWPETFSNYMLENFGNKMAMIPTNSQYGKDWINVIKPVWEEKGGEIVYEGEIDFAKETDYYTIMTNALNTDPDVLLVGGPSEPTSLVIKQAKDLGFEGGFMLMDQTKMEEMSGFLEEGYDLLNGSIGVYPIDELDTEASKTFIEKYTSKFNEKFATVDSQLSYQTLFVLVESIKAAGTVDEPKEIMDAVNEGIQNLSEDKMILQLNGIDDEGGLQWEVMAGVVENGEVKAIPLE